MCVQPVTIRNPRIDFRAGIDPLYVTVPCGVCEECQERKGNDWFVRLWSVKQQFKDGTVLFPTFTYNPESIPSVNFDDPEIKSICSKYSDNLPTGSYYSFDKEGIQNMIKKLRTRISRRFGHDDFLLKYIVVCEYGEDDRFTHRCHYHSLFFLNESVDSELFKNYLEWCWSSEIKLTPEDIEQEKTLADLLPVGLWSQAVEHFKIHQDKYLFCPYGNKRNKYYNYVFYKDKRGKIHVYFKNGFVSYSNNGAIVDDNNALSYITKYIKKVSGYISSDYFTPVHNLVSKLPPNDDPQLDLEKLKVLKHVKGILPFILSSTNLGLDLLKQYEYSFEDTSSQRFKELIKMKLDIDGYTYLIPQYIIRKLFYSSIDVLREATYSVGVDKEIYTLSNTKKVVLNEIGLNMLQMRFNYSILDMIKHYKNISSCNIKKLMINAKLTDDERRMINRAHDISYPLPDFEILAIYKLLYQNVDISFIQDYLHCFTPESIKKFSRSFLNYKLTTFNDLTKFFSAPVRNPAFLSSQFSKGICNHLPLFENFDYWLSYFQIIDTIIKRLRIQKRREFVGSVEQFNNFFNSLIYGI